MKNREGFVSNSSSCSFVIKKDKLEDIKKFRDALNEQIEEWEDMMYDTDQIEDYLEDHGIDNYLILGILREILDDDYYGRTS